MDLTQEPQVDLEVDPETGDFSILTGHELLEARYEKWTSHQMDLGHPATVLPSNKQKYVPYSEQFWDKRLDA